MELVPKGRGIFIPLSDNWQDYEIPFVSATLHKGLCNILCAIITFCFKVLLLAKVSGTDLLENDTRCVF